MFVPLGSTVQLLVPAAPAGDMAGSHLVVGLSPHRQAFLHVEDASGDLRFAVPVKVIYAQRACAGG